MIRELTRVGGQAQGAVDPTAHMMLLAVLLLARVLIIGDADVLPLVALPERTLIRHHTPMRRLLLQILGRRARRI